MAGKPRVDLTRPARWWVPFTFAGTVALVVVAVTVPWTPWPADDFGHAPWWVWGPLVAATVLFVVGLGERKHTAWAGVAAGAAAVAGSVGFLAWPPEKVVVDGRREDQIRALPWEERILDVPPEQWHTLYSAEPPAAPLACGLAAALVLVLCVVLLARRQRPRTTPGAGPEEERPYPTEAGLRRTRRAMAAGLVGVLVGGLMGAGTAFGASRLQQERMAALAPWWGQLADSVPVPEDRLHEGAVEWDGEKRFVRLPEEPARVAWQHDFPAPVALSTCGRDGRARATLVALEESAERSVIVGHDARDGTPRWSLTVHRHDTAGLSQVAVGEDCSVLVLIGTVLLAVDSYSGQVQGSSVLPRAVDGAWHFLTPAGEQDPWPRLVSLHASEHAHLTAWQSGIVAVQRGDARLVAWTDSTTRGCTHVVDYSGLRGESGQLLMDDCLDLYAVAVLPELETPEELREQRSPAYRVPPMQPLLARETPVPAPPPGCRSGPLWIRSASVTTLVETELNCAGTKYRARVSIREAQGADDQVWELSPEANTVPDLTFVRSEGPSHLLEVWGDTMRMLSGDRFDAWWTVAPQPGDPVVALADSDVVLGDPFGDTYQPILALTRSGTLVALADLWETQSEEHVRVTASSDVARRPCAAERGLLADKASGTALVLCTTNGRTHVTAVVD